MHISDEPTYRRLRRGWIVAAFATLALAQPALAHDELPAHHKVLPSTATAVMKAFWLDQHLKEDLDPIIGPEAAASNVCDTGFAGAYPCNGVDLLSFLPLDAIGGTASNSAGNDIWGWTAPDGSEYAIMGRVFGTSFVDISDPVNPVYLGNLPTHGAFGSSWRDIKVYGNYAYIVSEALNHGMQVFDLMQLETMNRANLPVTFAETGHYSRAAASHNLHINEDSGFAYMVGNSGKNSCSGGLHMVNLSNPTNPRFAGCFSADGYTHDVQCVNYDGPDGAYANAEICFASNEDTLTIVNVTDKSNPVMISRTPYSGSAYTHQGWLSADHAYFLVDDELDEQNFRHNTRTRVFDVSDLTAPSLVNTYDGTTGSIDHNLYTVGTCAIEANYRSGLRIVNFAGGFDVAGAEEGYFDIYPANDDPQFNGMWSNYPYFPSGVIIASGIEQGLYVLKPTAAVASACGFPVPGNTPPTVSIKTPANLSSFPLGTEISFSATSADAEDPSAPLVVWSSSLNSGLGSGSPLLVSSLSAGTHTITAVVTDEGGLSASDSISVTVASPGGGTQLYIQSLVGSVIANTGRRYTGQVLITVQDENGATIEAATVSGTWSGAAKGSGSCATNVVGQCDVTKSGKVGPDMIFTVESISHTTLTYAPGSNAETAETITSP
ncbi:choice-of-anchor B family protein [bacterium]|nr:choice-of-anchor B family protein [bacterium]